MSTSAPVIKPPASFPEHLAWLQHTVRTHVRPYHVAIGAAVGIITVVFLVVIGVLVLISTNFNLLGAIE